MKLPYGVAVDPGAGGSIGPTRALTKISFANLDGSGGNNLSTTFATVDAPFGVALDPATKRLYWSNDEGTVAISFTSLNGFGGGDLKTLGAPANGPGGIALDSTAGKIYWPDIPDDKLSFANLDGSGGDASMTGLADRSDPYFVALLETPVGAGAPTIDAGASVGSVSCSSGGWASDEVASFLYRAPHTFAYQWSLDGVDIPGATANTLTPSVPAGTAAK